MSSLRAKNVTIKKQCKPSPANKMVFIQKLLSQTKKTLYMSVKRMSWFISGMKSTCTKGSMTVEAALLIPLFLYFFLHLSGVMEMLRLHGSLAAALWNAGNQIALYTDTFSDAAEELPDAGISYLLVNNQVRDFLGRDYLGDSPLVQGTAGLNYLRSEYLGDKECVDIFVTYQVEPPLSIFPFSYRRMCNRYYARAWTGYDVSDEDVFPKYVYVTSQGEVWHGTPDCSYIYHQVLNCLAGQIGSRKNAQGKYYEKCNLCEKQTKGRYVYFTEEGEKYHLIRNCTAIHKDILAIEWTEDLPYRACSRCGG